MIISKNVNVKIINHNIRHYNDRGYFCKYGDIISVNVNDLTNGSHVKIDVKCDKCQKENKIRYQDYVKVTKGKTVNYYCQLCVKSERNNITNLKKYGFENVSYSDIIKNKKKQTNLKNWGVENVFQSEIIKDKSKQTNLKKYGFLHPNQSQIIKDKTLYKRLKSGNIINPVYHTEYSLYRKNVLMITRKFKKELFEKWNGLDYYDNEYIKDYLKLSSNDKKYPTIDHKISILEGFNKKIDFKIIGDISNLCLTKRKINSSKNSKCHIIFIKENNFK